MIRNGQPDALLSWMQSLADPARLRVLRLLERQELGVAELCDVLQMPQSTVSRHLKLLSGEAWIRSRREGTNNLYRMSLDDLSPPARKLWTIAREQTTSWPTLEQDRLRLERVLAHREKDSQTFFASAAGQWDTLRDWLYGKSFTGAALLALLPSEWTIADLGCGTGAVAIELARNVKKVIGVDQNATMLRAAQKRAADLKNVELRKGDLDAIPIDDKTCDAALLMLTLTYVKDVPAVLKEACRIVRPGGKLVIVDLLRHDRDDFRRDMGQVHPGFESDELESSLKSAGFKHPQTRPLPPEAEAKGPALLLATAVK